MQPLVDLAEVRAEWEDLAADLTASSRCNVTAADVEAACDSPDLLLGLSRLVAASHFVDGFPALLDRHGSPGCFLWDLRFML